jgi:hypothetical protein
MKAAGMPKTYQRGQKYMMVVTYFNDKVCEWQEIELCQKCTKNLVKLTDKFIRRIKEEE